MTTQAETLKKLEWTLRQIAQLDPEIYTVGTARFMANQAIAAIATVSSEAQPVAYVLEPIGRLSKLVDRQLHFDLPVSGPDWPVIPLVLVPIESPAPDVRPSVLSDEQVVGEPLRYTATQSHSHGAEMFEKGFQKGLTAQPETSELIVAAKAAASWLQHWLDENSCECEGSHTCGKDQRRDELNRLNRALASQSAAPAQQKPFGHFHELLNHEGQGSGVWLGCPSKSVTERAHTEGETGKEIVALYTAPVAAQPQDVKAIHSAVLALQCDLKANKDQQYGFQAGVHRAAAVVSQFAVQPLQDKPQEAGPSVSVDERGWLLEQVSCPHPMWMKADGHMTKDASRAIRFARECDANAFLNLVFSSKEIDFAKLLGRSNYQATEHIWHDFDPSIAALNTAPAVQEAAEVSIDDDKFWSLLSDWADVRGYQGEKRSPCVERAEDAILFYVHRWAVSLLLAAAAPSAPPVPADKPDNH